MRVLGIDFTSRPSSTKPITCAVCRLEDEGRLVMEGLERLPDLAAFEARLAAPGPWIAGLDFPFGQARRFVETMGWPLRWAGYVGHVGGMDRAAFRDALTAYRAPRAKGDKEHRRGTDIAAGSISPQKLFGTPVGFMFYEGAPRLLRSGAHIPPVHPTGSDRVVLEAYPGLLARRLIGRTSYKNDARAKQTGAQRAARALILERLEPVDAPTDLADDPSGDSIDALLCAVQAGWAFRLREEGFGIPADADPLEGWICDPGLRETAL